MSDVTKVKIEPMVVTFGEDVAQISTVTTRADVSGDLNNDYFFLYEPDGTKYHVWFDVDSGGADPDPGGSTAVEVDISADDTAGTIATAIASQVDGLAAFSASAVGNVITITNADNGYAPGPHEGVGTSFTFAVTTQGDEAADVGYVDGDIEISHSEDKVDITAHETGTNVLSQIRTGKQVELTVNLKETTISQIRRMMVLPGGAYTPAGAGGTELFGFGSHKDFTQTITHAKKLVMHPKVLGASDKSRDYTFWKAYPQIDAETFSGENIFVVPVVFKVYPDTSKNETVQYFAIGDSSQV